VQLSEKACLSKFALWKIFALAKFSKFYWNCFFFGSLLLYLEAITSGDHSYQKNFCKGTIENFCSLITCYTCSSRRPSPPWASPACPYHGRSSSSLPAKKKQCRLCIRKNSFHIPVSLLLEFSTPSPRIESYQNLICTISSVYAVQGLVSMYSYNKI